MENPMKSQHPKHPKHPKTPEVLALKSEIPRTHQLDHMMAWAGQSCALSKAQAAGELLATLWTQLEDMLEPRSRH